MSAHTKPQIIKGDDGTPLYAVVPYDEYLELIGEDDSQVVLPNEVAKMIALKGYSPLKAWRVYRGINQGTMAAGLNCSQGNISQIEAPDKKNQESTIEAWAQLVACDVNQLKGM